MLKSLLNAISYWFSEEHGTGIGENFTKALWIAVIVLGALFALLIVVMFFKAIIRTKQRRAEKRRREEEEQAKLAAELAAKEEEKRQRKERRLQRQEERRLEHKAAKAEKKQAKADRQAERKAEKKAKREEKKAKGVKTDPVVAVVAPAEEPKPVKKEEPVIARVLVGISVNDLIVQREFTVGDEFNCDGLLVKTEYNMPPFQEVLADFTLVDAATFDSAMRGELSGVYVCRPDLNYSGKRAVRVCFERKIAVYTISVVEKPVEKPVTQSEPVVVERVIEKIVEVPVEKVVEKIVEVPVERVVEKVVEVPIEKVVEVPVVQSAPQPTQPQVVETVIIDEERYEAGRLRYDKSFEAKFIQSDDEVKHWYTEIKNVLLSYKGCKGRISWKRETFKAKKDVVAKLVFRGNTLCLFLPLNPQEFADNKEIEDASNLPVYEDTPVMIRLKNEKRKRMAITLIERVMMERGILHGAHQSEDFYLPYEGVVELINRGLIKREIKTVEDEAIFERDKEEE